MTCFKLWQYLIPGELADHVVYTNVLVYVDIQASEIPHNTRRRLFPLRPFLVASHASRLELPNRQSRISPGILLTFSVSPYFSSCSPPYRLHAFLSPTATLRALRMPSLGPHTYFYPLKSAESAPAHPVRTSPLASVWHRHGLRSTALRRSEVTVQMDRSLISLASA
jgi:hypothetical protein